MATKTHIAGPEYEIDSEAVNYATRTSDHIGTAIALIEAVEESGERVGKVVITSGKVTIQGTGMDRGETAVPAEVHSQLLEWGYEHVGEGGGDASYTHTDDVMGHVYLK